MRILLTIIVSSSLILACRNSSTESGIDIASAKNDLILTKLPEPAVSSFIDNRDSNVYNIIRIGNQSWTAGMFKYHSKQGIICRDYLYNWVAAANACPDSFRIPSDKDWEELFAWVKDSVMNRLAPELRAELIQGFNDNRCKECNNIHRKGFASSSVISSGNQHPVKNDDVLMLVILERLGFCTYGSGFRYNGGTGVDDNSYFWSSTTDKNGAHKFISFLTGDYCHGCGYTFRMPFNDSYGFNLKLILNKTP